MAVFLVGGRVALAQGNGNAYGHSKNRPGAAAQPSAAGAPELQTAGISTLSFGSWLDDASSDSGRRRDHERGLLVLANAVVSRSGCAGDRRWRRHRTTRAIQLQRSVLPCQRSGRHCRSWPRRSCTEYEIQLKDPSSGTRKNRFRSDATRRDSHVCATPRCVAGELGHSGQPGVSSRSLAHVRERRILLARGSLRERRRRGRDDRPDLAHRIDQPLTFHPAGRFQHRAGVGSEPYRRERRAERCAHPDSFGVRGHRQDRVQAGCQQLDARPDKWHRVSSSRHGTGRQSRGHSPLA